MSKGLKRLHLIGYILEAIIAVFCIFVFVISILITTPMSREIIEKGLRDGTIAMDTTISIEQNINNIQTLFTYFTLVFAVFMLAYVANTIICFLVSKGLESKKIFIISLILSVIGFNPVLIAANSLLLRDSDVEVIEVN